MPALRWLLACPSCKRTLYDSKTERLGNSQSLHGLQRCWWLHTARMASDRTHGTPYGRCS
jgi:uncharacterized protein YbaR (Trm112 family)